MTAADRTTQGGTTAAGWYPDPVDACTMRYWDGTQWTSSRTLNVPSARIAGATVTNRVAMTATSWFVLVGVVLGAIGALLPWEQDTTPFGSQITRGPGSVAGGVALLFGLLALAVWIAWPSRSGRLSIVRELLLTVVTVALGIFVVAKIGALAHASQQAHQQVSSIDSALGGDVIGASTTMSYGPGLGLFVYGAGVAAIAIAMVRSWFMRIASADRRA